MILIEDYSLTSKQRLNAANEARDDYDFGVQTTGLGDWFAEEAGHLFCFLYVGAQPVTFHITFEVDSAKVRMTYAHINGEQTGFPSKANEDDRYQATLNLYRALRARWVAAGKPGCATEMCLWEMERLLSYADKTGHSFKETLTEGIELLEAWIEDGGEQTEAERIALEMAKKFIE